MNSITSLAISMMLMCSVFSTDFSAFHWLNGIWEMPKPNGSYRLESWESKGSNVLSGKGLKVMQGDTTHLESITLYSDQNGIWYTPTVPDQNNQQPVPFKLVASGTHQFTFENPEHDFPQRIVYEFKPVDKDDQFISSPGDTLDVAATDLNGDGIQFRFFRK
ncbi:MAG: hypothetical protein KBA14_01560 [Saprospiraceae bacterium]|nr:hypothetical protein [Saprospiraceae bacterium]